MAVKTKIKEKELPDKKNPKLIISFTKSDLEGLMDGENFKWTFATDGGQDIYVLLRLEVESDVEELEDEDTDDTFLADSF